MTHSVDGKTKCDFAVIGLGVMGSAAAHELATRGKDICAFEQFDLGHRRGSSHGESRAIRMAYSEGPFYVKLLQEAYEKWDELQGGRHGRLFKRVGILEAGYPGSELVQGVWKSAQSNNLVDKLGSRESLAHFPQFHIPEDWDVVFERNGGFLRPELIVAELQRLAEAAGAKIWPNTPVTKIIPKSGSVMLETVRGTIKAGAVIVTTGPWMTSEWLQELLPALKPRLTLTRQSTVWFQPARPERLSQIPVFALEVAKDKIFYGFPSLTEKGVKVAAHTHGAQLEDLDAPLSALGAGDIDPLRDFLSEYLPDAVGPISDSETCIYTNTADAKFIVDRHSSYPHIVFASPCSGHGFKFASILGPILADMAQGNYARYERLGVSNFKL
jgi:sarcosine oxidase